MHHSVAFERWGMLFRAVYIVRVFKDPSMSILPRVTLEPKCNAIARLQAKHHNDMQPSLHHMRSSLDEFDLALRVRVASP